MKVFFRVDASDNIGTGHLMRCLTLAAVLRTRGLDTHFICRDHPGSLIVLLQQQAVPVTILPAPEQLLEGKSENCAALLLGVTQSEDAEQTILALKGERPDWLIVDHYGLGTEWEQKLRPYTMKLMVIDDLVNSPHDCDLLLNQNFLTESEKRYRALAAGSSLLLLGPRYALLRSEYVVCRNVLRPRDNEVRHVLVYFGGTDLHNITGVALEALCVPQFRHLEVDVVIGPNNPHRTTLEKQIKSRTLTKLISYQPHLANLMAQADLAIGAGGATMWERMCLGLPSLVVGLANNQQPICEALMQADLIHYLGDYRNVCAMDVVGALKTLIGSHIRLQGFSTRSQLLVDGFGALRVAEALYHTSASKLRLRPACYEDIGFYFNWVNDPEVRNQAFYSEPIEWSVHQEWFMNKLSNSQSQLFVLLAEGSLPVGQIRFDKIGDEAVIDYSLDPLVRGRGWGAQLVAMGSAIVLENEKIRIRAEVKAENHASKFTFERLGFKQAKSTKTCKTHTFYLDSV